MTSLETLDEERTERLERLLRDAPLPFIAGRIRRARRSLGLSHDAFGEPIGIIRQHLIGLEKGRHRPRLATLLRIAARAQRDPEWFVDEEIDPSPFPEDGNGAV